MGKFNTKAVGTKTINAAGGQAYKQSADLALLSILLTSFASDKAYEKTDVTFQKVRELIPACDKKFVAQAAIYARTEFGMRSISHVVAAELAQHISGEPWARSFYTAIINRVDDMSEIISYYQAQGNKKLSAAMRNGFQKAFNKFDAYSLAKYRGEGKGVKLIDVVNLVHPVPTDDNRLALAELVQGTLKSTTTWESISSDSSKFETKKEKWECIIDMWIW